MTQLDLLDKFIKLLKSITAITDEVGSGDDARIYADLPKPAIFNPKTQKGLRVMELNNQKMPSVPIAEVTINIDCFGADATGPSPAEAKALWGVVWGALVTETNHDVSGADWKGFTTVDAAGAVQEPETQYEYFQGGLISLVNTE